MMNCQKTEKLIPLFVEADLGAVAMQQVTTHLETCHSCRHLAAEFQASQSSLRALALPAFDEAMFAEMRTAVQQAVAPTTTQPALAEWWQPFWQWKVAVAALVLCVSGLVFYAQFKAEQEPAVSILLAPPTPIESCCGAGNVRDLRVGQAHAVGKSGRARSPHRNRIAPSAALPPKQPEAAPAETATVAPTLAFAEPQPEVITSAPEPEMLRMEFQTADPNIRIIWLTPKTALASNPRIDSR